MVSFHVILFLSIYLRTNKITLSKYGRGLSNEAIVLTKSLILQLYIGEAPV